MVRREERKGGVNGKESVGGNEACVRKEGRLRSEGKRVEWEGKIRQS